MKTPTKFVQPLTEEQREQLKEVMKSQSSQRTRMRAHAILLSERRYSIDQSADIYQVDRDRVSEWLDWWEEYQFDGLDDDPRSGRPPKLTEKEQKHAVKLTLKEPRSLRQGLTAIATTVGKIISRDTLKRILAAEDYGWKRLAGVCGPCGMRRSFAPRTPNWPPSGRKPGSPRGSLISGISMKRGSRSLPVSLTPGRKWDRPFNSRPPTARARIFWAFSTCTTNFIHFAFEGSIDTQIVIHCFNLFRQQLERPAVVVVDNAPIHTSDDFAEQKLLWQAQDLAVKFIPPYCPELNLIEILWRTIKYEWLPLDAYQSFKAMTRALFEVLRGIGPKYRITFA